MTLHITVSSVLQQFLTLPCDTTITMFFQNFTTGFVLLVSVIIALGSPLPASNATDTLERRISHVGRVR